MPGLLRSALMVAALTAGTTIPPLVSTDRAADTAHGCRQSFDTAVRRYVTSTDDRDAAAFNALLDPDVTLIFANGGVLSGRQESADFITGFFADPGWTQTFREVRRHVDGCDTGFVLFDSVYSVPAQQRVSPLVIGVTFTREHGRWLVLHNQDSTGPVS